MGQTIREQIVDIMSNRREYTSKELSELLDSSQSKSGDFYKVVRAEVNKMSSDGIIEEGVGKGTWRLI